MNYIHEAKEFLRQYKNLRIANDNLRDKIAMLRTELEGYKPVNSSGMPGGGSSSPDDSLCNLIFERDRNIEALQANSLRLSKATAILNKLDKESLDILKLSFIESEEKTDTEIAKELGIGRTTLNEKRRRALKEFSIQLFGIKAM